VRYLILSDLHANIDALDAVLDRAAEQWDAVVVLGDLVGYGGAPNAVVSRVQRLAPVAVVRGNHDKVSSGIEDGRDFNYTARMAALWTRQQLTPENLEYVRGLAAGPIPLDDRVLLCHGAPFDEDHYVFDAADAALALNASTRPLCLFGHTHLPVIYRLVDGAFSGEAADPDREMVLRLQRGAKYLVNPGSVGQPRDGDPRAAYALLDDEAQELRLARVEYPVAVAQQRIIRACLPASLANRLALGR
jgi:predicted phosphodiesterase